MPYALGKVVIGISTIIGLYSLILGALLTPSLQRFSLYAHKINTLFYHDINNPQDFGFAKGQVTAFTIATPDGETLYAWHILPVDVYARKEATLRKESRSDGPVEDFTKTTAFNLLTSSSGNEKARVVVNFHGNAGHIAQGYRPDTYRYLTSLPDTHVLTIDYRGFGHSSGSPTEMGLLVDGVTLVNWVLNVAHAPSSQIVLLGQSLGTAVASAVALHFTETHPSFIPEPGSDAEEKEINLGVSLEYIGKKPIAFAAIILVAPFSSLPSLMLTYRIGGFVPILLPFRPFPRFADYITSQIVDTWQTAERLAKYYTTLSALSTPHYDTYSMEMLPGLLRSADGRAMGGVQVFHAVDDWDIDFRQTEMLCRRILRVGDERCDELGKPDGALVEVNRKRPERPRLRFEILGSGGHNRIMTYSPIYAAVVRAFEGL